MINKRLENLRIERENLLRIAFCDSHVKMYGFGFYEVMSHLGSNGIDIALLSTEQFDVVRYVYEVSTMIDDATYKDVLDKIMFLDWIKVHKNMTLRHVAFNKLYENANLVVQAYINKHVDIDIICEDILNLDDFASVGDCIFEKTLKSYDLHDIAIMHHVYISDFKDVPIEELPVVIVRTIHDFIFKCFDEVDGFAQLHDVTTIANTPATELLCEMLVDIATLTVK